MPSIYISMHQLAPYLGCIPVVFLIELWMEDFSVTRSCDTVGFCGVMLVSELESAIIIRPKASYPVNTLIIKFYPPVTIN